LNETGREISSSFDTPHRIRSQSVFFSGARPEVADSHNNQTKPKTTKLSQKQNQTKPKTTKLSQKQPNF